MRVLLKFVIGLVVVPVSGIALFVLVNWVLSLLFNSDFQSLNHSSVWMIEALIIIAFIISYLTYALDED